MEKPKPKYRPLDTSRNQWTNMMDAKRNAMKKTEAKLEVAKQKVSAFHSYMNKRMVEINLSGKKALVK